MLTLDILLGATERALLTLLGWGTDEGMDEGGNEKALQTLRGRDEPGDELEMRKVLQT